MGDGPVLAENTAQGAVGKEDGARSIYARYRFLFTEMGIIAEDHWAGRSAAEPLLTLCPIYPAPPGTELAALEDAVGLLDPLRKSPLFLQFLVGWLP
jgi:hypothetical protein